MREIAIVRKIDTKSRETNQRKAHGERDPDKIKEYWNGDRARENDSA